ncbi:MAG: hypothetical protein A3C70_00665 [Candidatus Zambryskibacteria bacterium RIFCSPHIGHO2_02_FULL_43_14]|uniref:Uncharacterized protein n=1 Tax=Candidatus Zambryskibacteria bacterium RIFCSPHIGHO2_02_FULL_43_14 TaxID=1802748 RepID=A0A1G2TE14_9BACT|nr:MAG: hypothetical protein A2829_02710 [Candidatus Zambryskibacteria bacterium RIFCSPHIGHO2_01_FULL_43_60]OHA95527.1 MAG: hypothetical protein A3C70_00665 [Candidatus Zambryskibacteria bacterium RIFCSPHIGHO2_02_FULL_43_14]
MDYPFSHPLFERRLHVNDNFRGHLEECLKHLTVRLLEAYPKGSKSAAKARQPMAEFCGVQIHAITGWLYRSDHLPRGEKYIKLLCFLEINGYKVIEFERLSQKCRNFARLIGFGLITSQQAAEMLGYSGVSPTSTLFEMLRGNERASSKVEEKLWDMWKVRKDKLDETIEKVTEKYRLNFSKVSNQSLMSMSENLVATNNNGCPRDGVVDIMQGLLRLLDSGVLQDLSDTDWTALRGSSSMILRLSSHLSTLSARLVRPG